MELVFYFSGLVAILATLRVITHTQPIHALLYLIVSLLAVASIFFSLGAYFAGAMEVIVYAGAIMVLFVFMVMLINMNVNYDKRKRAWFRPLVWMGIMPISLVLLAILVSALTSSIDQNIVGNLVTAKTVGVTLFGPYILVVELASMLLLAGLIVAFHLGKGKHNNADQFCKKKITNIIKTIKEEQV